MLHTSAHRPWGKHMQLGLGPLCIWDADSTIFLCNQLLGKLITVISICFVWTLKIHTFQTLHYPTPFRAETSWSVNPPSGQRLISFHTVQILNSYLISQR